MMISPVFSAVDTMKVEKISSLKRRDLSCKASVMKRRTVMLSLKGGAYV